MGVDLKRAKEEHDSLQDGGYSSFEYLVLEEGPNVLRIVPPFGNNPEAWKKVKMAYGIGPNGKVVVPKFDENCSLKKEIERLKALPDEASKERADKMYPKNRVFFWVIARAPHKQAGKGPVAWNANMSHNYKDILGIFADPEYGDISDPNKGVDITVNFTPKEKTQNGFPDWQIIPKRNPTPLGTPEEIAAWTSECLFTKYGIGKCSEDAYVRACIEGVEAAYLESLKGTQHSQSQQPPSHPGAPPAQQVVRTIRCPEGEDKEYWMVDASGASVKATAKQIGEVMLAGRSPQVCSMDGSSGWKSAETMGFCYVETPVAPPPQAAPPPPAPPAAPPPPAPVAPPPPIVQAPPPPSAPPPPVATPPRKFWIFKDGQQSEVDENQLKTLVAQGFNGHTMLVGETAWKSSPKEYGIGGPTAPPPPPVGPPAPPAPPSGGAGLSSEEEALKAQIAQLRATLGSGAQSQVAADLAAKLK